MRAAWVPIVPVLLLLPVATARSAETRSHWVWRANRPQAWLIAPELTGPMESIVTTTLNTYFADAYGWSIPHAADADKPGLYIVAGNEANNPVLFDLSAKGLDIGWKDAGDEGFRILTHESGDRRFVIVTAKTPIGLKHGCQELMYFHMQATAEGATVDWPIDVKMKPQFAYRGVYILPCWAAYDSLASWKRVLAFHSELTLNRNWFWLAGFPLLEQYGGEYKGTDLADANNVNGLVSLCRAEGMKFYIGGGWYTWHHEKIAAGSIERGIMYYRDMLALLPGAEGIYLEPAGEGGETKEATWRERTEALRRLIDLVGRDRPGFEFAIAIGEFNAPAYRQAMHQLNYPQLYWWWCWGDPIRDNALAEHPLVLRWHTIIRMSEYHGSNDPPKPGEIALTGFATSYDPGQGFGNPWNGWGKLGVDKPRNVHPYTMPFFSHQYRFREHCWNVNLTDEQFAGRLSRRLFDADMPPEAIQHYLALADLCPKPKEADGQKLDAIDSFVKQHAGKGTPRNRDTLMRMAEAIEGIRQQRAQAQSQPEKK